MPPGGARRKKGGGGGPPPRKIPAGCPPPRKKASGGETPAATPRQMVFGIVQGATFEELRRTSAQTLAAMDFDGYAVGGVSVGEPEPEMMQAVGGCQPHLPANKPRYAMGLRAPPQKVEVVARGVDMFD